MDISDRLPGPLDGLARPVEEVMRGAFRMACIGLGSAPPTRLPWVLPAIAHRGSLVGAAFRLRAATHPERTAVVDSRGAVTYAELNERVNRLANILVGEGLGSGRLGLLLPNCRELLEGIGAAAKLGVSPIPINTRFHAEEVLRLLEVQGATAVVVDSEYADRVLDYDGIVLVRGDDYESALAGARAAEPAGNGVDAPLVIHTSGTTGHPKGAERKLESTDPTSLLGFMSRVPVSAGDTLLVPAPLFHALGFFGVGVGMGVAGTQIYQDRFDPAAFLRLAEEHKANGAALVPVMLKRILDLGADVVGRHDLSSLRYMVVSGSQLPPPLAERAREVLGPVVRNLYGSTEGGWVTIATPDDMASHPGTVGRPLPGIGVEIHDDSGHPVEPGGIGEIVVRSRFLFSGYTEDKGSGSGPAAAGTYEMGDLGRFDEDGYLYVADRKDDMVVTGGENVYPAEVERVLEVAPGISDLTVLGVPDEEYGHILVAFVVADPAATPPDPDELERYCRAHLANYKVPKAIWVVDALPYTATGKVLRRVLREDAVARLAPSQP